ncbi:MAG: hypothetical protein JXR61_05595, partial [Prolixibacteraceae bacterium]|nr:hypothetical protein [Prolixibacteraceae bacterium]
KAALSRVTSSSALTDIAMNDPSPEIRKMAVTRVTSSTALINIAKNDKDPGVRKMALESLEQLESNYRKYYK